MKLFVLGLNHKSAPIEIRERFAIPEQKIDEFLSRSVRLPHVEEALVLSTCNRVEIYGASRHPLQAKQQLSRFLAEFHQSDPSILEKHSYFYEDEKAIRHGLRVASSLDSMVIGEAQILGQIKEAYRYA